MKGIFIIIFLLFSISLSCQTIKVGFFDGYPSFYREPETGEALGSSLSYIRDLILETGYNVEFIGPHPFPRLMSMLKNGEIDGLMGISKNPEREKYILYPEAPYIISELNIIVLKDGPIKELEDIYKDNGYLFSFRRGASLPAFFDSIAGVSEIHYLSKETWITQSIELLLLGRITGIINQSPEALIHHAKTLNKDKLIKKIVVPGVQTESYLGISKKSIYSILFIEKYNEVIKNTKLKIEDYSLE